MQLFRLLCPPPCIVATPSAVNGFSLLLSTFTQSAVAYFCTYLPIYNFLYLTLSLPFQGKYGTFFSTSSMCGHILFFELYFLGFKYCKTADYQIKSWSFSQNTHVNMSIIYIKVYFECDFWVLLTKLIQSQFYVTQERKMTHNVIYFH